MNTVQYWSTCLFKVVEHSPCHRNHWTHSGIDSWTQSVLGNHWTQSGIDSWTQDVEPYYLCYQSCHFRIQGERFQDESSYQEACKNYVINARTLNQAKAGMKILHPLPRNKEIDPEVDNDQDRAAYFRQAENGKYIRMALLANIL